MTFDYAKTAATSLKLLTKFGRSIARKAYSGGTYDPATGATTPTVTNSTRTGAIFDFGAGKTLERGNLIQVGDKRLLIDPTAAVNMEDHFVVGGTEYSIVSVGEINPAGTVVLYDIHARKA